MGGVRDKRIWTKRKVFFYFERWKEMKDRESRSSASDLAPSSGESPDCKRLEN